MERWLAPGICEGEHQTRFERRAGEDVGSQRSAAASVTVGTTRKTNHSEHTMTRHAQSLSRYQSKLPARTHTGSWTHTRAGAALDSKTGSAVFKATARSDSLCSFLAGAVQHGSPCSHGYFICRASHARHLFDVAVATRTEVGTVGAGVAVHLPVNLHGFSVREEEDS